MNKKMKSKKVTEFIILLVFLSSFSMINIDAKQVSTNNSNTLYVGGTGEGNFSLIQMAIDSASNDDLIFVFDDSSPYYENIVINKKIDLVGENKESTIIDSQNKENVVKITANEVKISGFTIRNSGEEITEGGIGVFSDDNTIQDNIIKKNRNGIVLMASSGNNISHNIICYNDKHQDSNGIALWQGDSPRVSCKNNIFMGNEIFSNRADGIWSDFSINTKVFDNQIYDNGGDGIFLAYDNTAEIKDNKINSNDNEGIRLFSGSSIGVHNINIHDNYISENRDGLDVYGTALNIEIKDNTIIKNKKSGIYLANNANGNIITENTVMFNEDNGIFIEIIEEMKTGELYYSVDNQIFLNNFILNGKNNADDQCTNFWDLESQGNYWSDWNGQGYYDIPGGENQDKYPLNEAYDVEGSAPSKPSKPQGTENGRINLIYRYSTSTTDPDGDQIMYLFDWSDGTSSGWIGPYQSNEKAYSSHTWNEQDTYIIKVKAKDIYGHESEWSDPLSITMPKNRAINTPLFNFLQQHPHLFPLLQYLLQKFLKL